MPRLLHFIVSLAVILLLLGILNPGVNGARPAARTTACMSNLKQLSGALRMYAADADDRLPPARIWTNAAALNLSTAAGHSPRSRPGQLSCPEQWKGGPVDSYALNQSVSGAALFGDEHAAEAVLLFESDLGRPNAAGTAQDVADPERHPAPSRSRGCGPVAQGNNFAFLDGHVKWLDEPPAFQAPAKASHGRKGTSVP